MGALRRAVYRAHFVVASFIGGLGFVALSAAGFVYALAGGRHRASVLMSHGFSALMRLVLGWRVEAEGIERLTRSSPAVYLANHQSNMDLVVHGAVYPRRCVVVGKKELALIPFFGWFFRAAGNIFIDRSNRTRALESLRAGAARARSEGLSVWLFPEGHRNSGPTLLPFKKGAFHIAIAAQAPLVPLVSEPVSTLFDGRRFLTRPGTIRIRVLPEIPTTGLREEDVDALAEQARAAMQQAFDDLAREAGPRIG
jgi:1-acyl-sn-glycerol-3-phosphate acyltransferase